MIQDLPVLLGWLEWPELLEIQAIRDLLVIRDLPVLLGWLE